MYLGTLYLLIILLAFNILKLAILILKIYDFLNTNFPLSSYFWVLFKSELKMKVTVVISASKLRCLLNDGVKR